MTSFERSQRKRVARNAERNSRQEREGGEEYLYLPIHNVDVFYSKNLNKYFPPYCAHIRWEREMAEQRSTSEGLSVDPSDGSLVRVRLAWPVMSIWMIPACEFSPTHVTSILDGRKVRFLSKRSNIKKSKRYHNRMDGKKKRE